VIRTNLRTEKTKSSVPPRGGHDAAQRTIQFGAFELGMDTGELRKNGLRVKLQGKAFQILQALLERPGGIVTREELKSRLWPSDTFVDFESGLNTAANRLRLTLGDSAENPRFIETASRLGYRFVAPVVEIGATAAELAPVMDAPPAEPLVRVVAESRTNRLRWILLGAGISLAALAVAGAFWIARKASPVPSFHQVTFRNGTVSGARFGPDGETIIYSASWGGLYHRLFLANTVSPESRPLDFVRVRLAGVSPSSELALFSLDSQSGSPSLSRVPLNGGAPLTVAKNVAGADWSPDGKNFAIFRITSRESVIEYPLGKVLYRTAGAISDLRISPTGDALAFMEHPVRGDDGGVVKLIDAAGVAKDLSGNWASAGGLAWAPSGKEIWFTAGQFGVRGVLYAVTRNGKQRQIATMPGTLTLFDISKTGRVLLDIDRGRLMLAGSAGDNSKQLDLSWFDWSHPQDISPDGKLLLFDETGNGGGPNHSVYLRNLETNSTVRLGDGQALALSPDLRWALALDLKRRTSLSLLPIVPDTPRTLAGQGLTYNWARFFPDGKKLLVAGNFPGKRLRLYVQSTAGGQPEPLNPDVYLPWAIVSPDGNRIAGFSSERKTVILPASGGELRELALPFAAAPVQWSADGKTLFVMQMDPGLSAIRVFRVDVATGQSKLWKEVAPSDPVGLSGYLNFVMSGNERAYAYSYFKNLSELFVFDGWK
jgi:eukaryotic-like serine/threonine-protein kinase